MSVQSIVGVVIQVSSSNTDLQPSTSACLFTCFIVNAFLECKCDFNEQWTIVTRANYISLLLLGASCSLNTTPCISPPHVAWNSDVFTKQPSQTPSHKSPAQLHFLMSPSEITTENKSTCTCTTTQDTSKLIHRCKALFIYSLK